jgi:membrane associated rhomboid family serine protease
MLIPIGDDNSQLKIFPIVNYTMIAINVLVFILLQRLGSNDAFTYAYCTVPAEIITGKDIVTTMLKHVDEATGIPFTTPGLYLTPIPVFFTLLTSAFMHGGIAHIFGNMLYLIIFGDNIENRLGHLGYFLFYIASAVLASLCHVGAVYFQGGNSMVPCVGASGAISAVLGAYLYLFPQNKVRVLLLYFPMYVPAFIALGAWIFFQVISGFGTLGGKSDGVAYAAHIGGFITGLLLMGLFVSRKKIEE